ncbi:MAG: Glycosyl transferase, group 1 family protein [Candidatus Curtissbacteria bacterium GW2011_GWA1_40_16]|uniref:Glycosyl transferase, group 1 family protein n=1 Tax=Candidatus Curtissbacteria bacterium GW2011_GWA1_40_16 TaxID=1618405 RepID=A0A0G0ULE2_9BACT|nr:MAG: Glycosyl transferase, group 1 family protein [Candidatus Curtissbacteria bacterium GW2011_GWA1_40_16]
MNILLTADNYKPQINGIVTYIINLRKELEKRGHNVTLVATDFPDSREEAGVIRIPSLGLPMRPFERIPLIWDSKTLKKLRQKKFDIVHNQTFVTGFLGAKIAREQNIPSVVTYHTPFDQYIHRFMPGLEKPLSPFIEIMVRYYFNKFDKVVIPSAKTLRSLSKIKSKPELIHNGIDLEFFKNSKPDKFLKEFKVDPKRPLILIAGLLDRGKNFEIAIDSMTNVKAQIPNALLVVAGGGTMKKHIRKQVARLGLQNNVILTGFIDREMIASANKAANLCLMVSIVDNLPTVALEAVASGKPLITIDDICIKDIVYDKKNGLLISPNAPELSQAIIKLVKNPKLCEEFGNQSLRIAQKFSIAKYADKIETLYRDLIQAKSN